LLASPRAPQKDLHPAGLFCGSGMCRLNRSSLLVMLLLSLSPLRADTIYQTNAQGKQVIIHRDAIVIKEDSTSILYKHFELRERRVVKVRLNRGSLPYSVVTSSALERQRIVETWKRFGYQATVMDQSGKAVRVFDVYLDFYPPGGRGSLLESVPPRTAFPILMEGGGADEFDFSKISRVEFAGDQLKVTLRNGEIADGRFLMPTDKPAEARLMGITEHYDPASEEVFDFSLLLARVREIRFE